MNLKPALFILFVLISCTQAAKADLSGSAPQAVKAVLPSAMWISQVILEDSSAYPKDGFLSKMSIESIEKINPSLNRLKLTPVQVEIETNTPSPVTVYAKFQELRHNASGFSFPQSDLFISPAFYNVNSTSHIFTTDYFTPYVYVRPYVTPGIYRGKLLFTLGGI